MNAPTLYHLPLCLLLGTCLPASAGRPLVTEDADILEAQACEWESSAARTRESGQRSVHGWSSQLGCGVGLQTQVAGSLSGSGGVEQLQLGGKTALLVRQEQAPGLALAWGIQAVKLPGGSFGHDVSYLNLALTQVLAPELTGHANVGLTHSKMAGERIRTWNLALEWAQGQGLDLLAEWYGFERSAPWLGLGLRWSASPAWSFNAALAHQGGQPRVRQFTLGVKLAL